MVFLQNRSSWPVDNRLDRCCGDSRDHLASLPDVKRNSLTLNVDLKAIADPSKHKYRKERGQTVQPLRMSAVQNSARSRGSTRKRKDGSLEDEKGNEEDDDVEADAPQGDLHRKFRRRRGDDDSEDEARHGHSGGQGGAGGGPSRGQGGGSGGGQGSGANNSGSGHETTRRSTRSSDPQRNLRARSSIVPSQWVRGKQSQLGCVDDKKRHLMSTHTGNTAINQLDDVPPPYALRSHSVIMTHHEKFSKLEKQGEGEEGDDGPLMGGVPPFHSPCPRTLGREYSQSSQQDDDDWPEDDLTLFVKDWQDGVHPDSENPSQASSLECISAMFPERELSQRSELKRIRHAQAQ